MSDVPSNGWVTMRQGDCVDQALIPQVAAHEFAAHLDRARRRGGRLAQLFGRRMTDGELTVYAFVAFDLYGEVEVCSMRLGARMGETGSSYPSVTALWPAAQAFEREIAEQFGVNPVGHPWLKPLRYHPADGGSAAPWGQFDPEKPIPGDYPFFHAEGEECHEVAVGPVHAGIIEPGHFRFQCRGEEVRHLEIVLGYQHRGAEPLLLHRNPTRSAIIAETIAGDASVGHALAYCTALECLSDAKVSLRAHSIRGIALELERLANHVGDLGALCTDIGFLPTSAYLGRLRGEFLNLTLELCGNRFGRNLLRPGGVTFDVSTELAGKLRRQLESLRAELRRVFDLMFSQPTVLARFEGTGALSNEQAEELGLVGVVARACGCHRDVRHDHPHGVFRFSHIPLAVETTGDVYARAVVRWLEVQRSIEFLSELLTNLPPGKTMEPPGPFRVNSLALGLSETWRGEAMYVASSDESGRLVLVKAKDPSIHNWFGLAQALRGAAISDFPLCNKSFNLSYAGHDL